MKKVVPEHYHKTIIAFLIIAFVLIFFCFAFSISDSLNKEQADFIIFDELVELEKRIEGDLADLKKMQEEKK